MSSFIRNTLCIIFTLFTTSPIFSMIEVRDSSSKPRCDTIIDKKGVISVVKIESLTKSVVTYTLCGDNSGRTYARNLIYIQDIKSHSFALKTQKEAPVEKTLEQSSNLMGASIPIFLLSFLAFASSIEGDNTSDFRILLFFILSILSLVGFVVGFGLLIYAKIKAKQRNNQKVLKKASLRLFLFSIFFTLMFILSFKILTF